MDKDQFITILRGYKAKLQRILSRFQQYRMQSDDDPLYRQKIQEVIDLLNDNLGRNDYSSRIVNFYNDGISNFTESPSYKSVENIIGVIGAVITRISRNPELLKEQKESDKIQTPDIKPDANVDLKFPDKVTFHWLWKNVPASIWFSFFAILGFVFTLGLYISGIPTIKNSLRYLPGYKVDLIVSQETQKNIESQITNIIKGHNERLSKFQTQLLEEEKLGADHNLIASYREYHQQAAQRIQNSIKDENENFQKEVKALNSFLE
jgi:hypothetical protein